jgi:hypothetical protein
MPSPVAAGGSHHHAAGAGVMVGWNDGIRDHFSGEK